MISMPLRPGVRVSVSQSFDPKERMTRSEFLKDCDINLVMARYKRTGVLPDSARQAAAQFGDFTQVPTFEEMHLKVIAAHSLFNSLPSAVRKEFDNDPGAFISAADTPQGRSLLVKLGLGSSLPSSSLTPPAASFVEDSPSVPSKEVKNSK